jgi:hypothetical protein
MSRFRWPFPESWSLFRNSREEISHKFYRMGYPNMPCVRHVPEESSQEADDQAPVGVPFAGIPDSWSSQSYPRISAMLMAVFSRSTMRTCYERLNQTLQRTHKNKAELLLVLERPDIPLHNNSSESDIRLDLMLLPAQAIRREPAPITQR